MDGTLNNEISTLGHGDVLQVDEKPRADVSVKTVVDNEERMTSGGSVGVGRTYAVEPSILIPCAGQLERVEPAFLHENCLPCVVRSEIKNINKKMLFHFKRDSSESHVRNGRGYYFLDNWLGKTLGCNQRHELNVKRPQRLGSHM